MTAKNNCKKCFAFRRLYSRLNVYFWENKTYYCAFHKKLIDGDCACENWQKENVSYDLSTERIDDAIRDVQIIADYCEKNFSDL